MHESFKKMSKLGQEQSCTRVSFPRKCKLMKINHFEHKQSRKMISDFFR